MDAEQQTVLLIVGVLAILFLIALFYILMIENKKKKTSTIKESKPQAATIETPKKVEAVQGVEPKPQAATVVTPKKAEPTRLEAAKTRQTARQKVSTGKKPAPKRKDRGSNISEIEGIGPVYAEKLNSIDIFTTSDLLESGATPRGRKELADKTEISPALILEWVNLSDLFR